MSAIVAHLHDLLDDVIVGAQSALELRYLQDVERAPRSALGRRDKRELGVVGPTEMSGTTRYATVVELDGQIHAGSRFATHVATTQPSWRVS